MFIVVYLSYGKDVYYGVILLKWFFSSIFLYTSWPYLTFLACDTNIYLSFRPP